MTTELIGRRFGKLIVVSYGGTKTIPSGKTVHLWQCKCDCGGSVLTTKGQLKSGGRKACGCTFNKHKLKHGYAARGATGQGHPLYKAWIAMRVRCSPNSSPEVRSRYFERGIRVCDRWNNSFDNFAEDMAPTWKQGLSLGRRDNDGIYEPSNCRWETSAEQNLNRRGLRWITYEGETKTVSQWCRKLNLSRATVSIRLGQGKPINEVLAPSLRKNPKANFAAPEFFAHCL